MIILLQNKLSINLLHLIACIYSDVYTYFKFIAEHYVT